MSLTTIVPLGGLGEIGLNALALESGGEAVLLDCGLMFPQPEYPGVEYLVPDFSWFAAAGVSPRAVLLTHGHEDHVGALAHFLQQYPIPVHGSPMTLGLVERRLREEAPSARKLLRPFQLGEGVQIGAFRAEFLAVTHSTAHACAVALETPGGTVLHTGDFKLDPTPVDGRQTDLDGIRGWAERGIDLLCCDSTNAGVPGRTASERKVGASLRKLFKEVEGRAYVTSFASNVHRFQQVLEASREVGRSVAFLGRSLTAAVRVARNLGVLRAAPGDIVPELRARRLPRRETTLVLTGSQGEAGSALFRLAHGVDPHHRILPGDAVFFCSRAIPGNELAIYGAINACLRQGAQVYYEEASEIHVSGHAAADDLVDLLTLARPRHLLPVHGERRHLTALARLAQGNGIRADRIFLLENGQTLRLEEGSLTRGPTVATGRVFVEAGECGPVEDPLIGARRRLGEEGLAVATLVLSPEGRILCGPTVSLIGVVPARSTEGAARAAEASLREALGRLGDAGLERGLVEAELKTALRRHFRKQGERNPLVVVSAVETGEEPGPASSRRG